MNWERLNIFASSIDRIRIDPVCYNKQDIITTIQENYARNPKRNNWDNRSDLHHAYQDWSNAEFENIDFDQLQKIYELEIEHCLNQGHYQKPFQYKVEIANITCYGLGQFMNEHDHMQDKTIFSAIHYVKLPENSAPLTFHNPLSMLHYNEHDNLRFYRELFDPQARENSVFWPKWMMKIQEDDLVIFPAYLRHSVEAHGIRDLRMAIVLNINWQGWHDAV